MVFGLFGNNEGKQLLDETMRTLEAADQLSDKNKKNLIIFGLFIALIIALGIFLSF